MKPSSFAALAACLSLTACNEKKNSPPAKTNTSYSSGNPLTAPADYLGAVNQGKKYAIKTLDTVQINRAIQLFYEQEDRFPKDLNELVTTRYLQEPPRRALRDEDHLQPGQRRRPCGQAAVATRRHCSNGIHPSDFFWRSSLREATPLTLRRVVADLRPLASSR